MKKIRKLSVVIAGLGLITSLLTTAFATEASFNTVFPAWKGHANVMAGTKVSSTDQNALIKCTEASNERQGVVFWIDRQSDNKRLTDQKWIPVDNTSYTLPYTERTTKGTKLMLRGCAEKSMIVASTAKGSVDFK